MSTKIGTLQAPRTTRSIWPAAVIASLLMLTVGIGAFFLGRDQATPTAKTVVGGTAADTPTQIIGGIAGGLSSTSVGGTAGSSWIGVGVTPAMQEAIVAARAAAEVSGELSAGTTAANTPSELSGGIRHKYVEDAVGANTPSELSGGLGNGLPAKIYDRHQRG
jgi:hypothetical protein